MQHYCESIEGWFNFPNIYGAMIQMHNDALFVEVGSWQGKSSTFMAVEIINSNKNIKLHCVDTWKGSDEHKEEGIVKSDNLYNTFLKNIEPVKHVITPIRMLSVDAARTYEDESIDFIFIDAAHDYESVRSDLYAWYPKVKKGGMIAGHDHSWPGVVKAVNEFITTSCHTLNIIGVEDCWGFLKRGKLLRVPTPEEAAYAIKALGKL